MLNWARSLLGSAASAGLGALRSLLDAAIAGITSVLDTVFGNVFSAWHDLARAAEIAAIATGHYTEWTYDHLRHLVGHDIPVYAQTAFWWVTHPEQLARVLFWHLVRMAEDNAFTVARYLGSFAISLAWHHADELAKTAEDIIDAIL